LGSSSNQAYSDETLPIINKSKHPKKGGIQGTKKEGPMFKKTKQPLKGTAREHQIPKPPLVTRSISNNETGGPFERTPNLEEPSPTAMSSFKIKTTWVHCNAPDTLCLQNVCKIERGGLLVPFTPHTMLAHQ